MMEEQPKYYLNEHGYEIWFLPSKGKKYIHRENGPAIIHDSGNDERESWYRHNKLHRIDGPAVSSTWHKLKAWWINGELHCIDGPAVTCPDRKDEWWINGNQLDRCEVEEWLEENEINLKEEIGQMAFKLRWS